MRLLVIPARLMSSGTSGWGKTNGLTSVIGLQRIQGVMA